MVNTRSPSRDKKNKKIESQNDNSDETQSQRSLRPKSRINNRYPKKDLERHNKIEIETNNELDHTFSGYNSVEEHVNVENSKISAAEWRRRDKQFDRIIKDLGFELRQVGGDGACLFRSIALQIYGDEEMHDVVRRAMDYIHEHREFFGHFITEDMDKYIKRKRSRNVFANQIEIKAISDVYNRTIEVYSYQLEPMNVFTSEQSQNDYPPLRVAYQRGCHYNAIVDPLNVGMELCQAGLATNVKQDNVKQNKDETSTDSPVALPTEPLQNETQSQRSLRPKPRLNYRYPLKALKSKDNLPL